MQKQLGKLVHEGHLINSPNALEAMGRLAESSMTEITFELPGLAPRESIFERVIFAEMRFDWPRRWDPNAC